VLGQTVTQVFPDKKRGFEHDVHVFAVVMQLRQAEELQD
jgi:hypothetical protein